MADPAPFKPIWLPADNPSEFTHFFDSSRRRVCYLAPERFIDVKSFGINLKSDLINTTDFFYLDQNPHLYMNSAQLMNVCLDYIYIFCFN